MDVQTESVATTVDTALDLIYRIVSEAFVRTIVAGHNSTVVGCLEIVADFVGNQVALVDHTRTVNTHKGCLAYPNTPSPIARGSNIAASDWGGRLAAVEQMEHSAFTVRWVVSPATEPIRKVIEKTSVSTALINV